MFQHQEKKISRHRSRNDTANTMSRQDVKIAIENTLHPLKVREKRQYKERRNENCKKIQIKLLM